MIREWLVEIYLFLFKIFFAFFKLFPKRDKVVFVASFSGNTRYVAEEFRRERVPCNLVFLCRKNCLADFRACGGRVLPFETAGFLSLLRSAFHLATAKTVFVDNYFGFLSVVRFRKGVCCIQLWHASGALKTFGLEDRSAALRTKRAKRRFRRVYRRFDKVIVGSDRMAGIFMRSFGIGEGRMLRTGIPQTDFFYTFHDRRRLFSEDRACMARLQSNAVSADGADGSLRPGEKAAEWERAASLKKKILYAPTFREDERDHFQLRLDLELMKRALGEDYMLLIRLHPAVRASFRIPERCSSFAFDCSNSGDVNEWLLASDLLITDYSSLPVDFALLGRPMIFYPYDLEDYEKERGFQGNYLDWVPGPVAFSTGDIVSFIKKGSWNLDKVAAFSDQWNTYSKGHSSRNVVHYVRRITDFGQ